MYEERWKQIDIDEPIPEHIREKMAECRRRRMILPEEKYIKRPSQIEGIRKAGVINTGVLDEVAKQIRAGMNTQDIDRIVAEYTKEKGAICAPLNYEGYPKSVCTSINEEVCHGIPSRLKKLHDGDIISKSALRQPSHGRRSVISAMPFLNMPVHWATVSSGNWAAMVSAWNSMRILSFPISARREAAWFWFPV